MRFFLYPDPALKKDWVRKPASPNNGHSEISSRSFRQVPSEHSAPIFGRVEAGSLCGGDPTYSGAPAFARHTPDLHKSTSNEHLWNSTFTWNFTVLLTQYIKRSTVPYMPYVHVLIQARSTVQRSDIIMIKRHI